MLIALFALLCMGAASYAQTFDLDVEREMVTPLSGPWRFHPGDDPRWAVAGFDDSQWVQLRSDLSWTKQGYPKLSGYAWYRFQVRTHDGGQPLALIFPSVPTGYQVFVDGKLTGTCGAFSPATLPTFPAPSADPFRLPTVTGPHTFQVALRVWDDPTFTTWLGGGPQSAGSFAGDPALLARYLAWRRATFSLEFANEYAYTLLASLVGLTLLTLFFFRRQDREYLWFSILVLAGAADSIAGLILNLGSLPFPHVRLAGEASVALASVAALVFFSLILDARRGVFWRFACVAAIVSPLTVGLFYFHWTAIGASYLVLLFCRLPSYLWIIWVLATSAFRENPTARLLLLPSLLYYGQDFLDLISFANWQYGNPVRIIDFNPVLSLVPFPLFLNQVFYFIFVFALLIFLVRRFSLARQEESRLVSEMDAARSLQSLSVPGAVQEITGFEIKAVYLPASEVGGDFFHLKPGNDGSLLVVVGDVSGKGLKAAMTVSTIIGALRGCTHKDPAAVLGYLNQVLCGQVSGFVTCCAALIGLDGRMILSNAGHLSPYLAGAELPLQSGLPLGLNDQELYEDREYEVALQQQLMFVSDGVVEACNSKGELYGFDRALKVSGQSAYVVAEAAKHFGQDDDITVVTIRRTT